MTTLPIRIAVRVDFSDGSQHEYEVRGQDTAEPLPGFWPEGVVTTDVAKRMEHDRKQQDILDALRDWAVRHRDEGNPRERGIYSEGFVAAAVDVLRILDGQQ